MKLPKPGPNFDAPFDMLTACHERLDRTLALLAKLRAHLPAHGADTQAQQAARDVMRYFDQAAPQHHRDEELHVFPPLVAQGDPAVLPVVSQLRQEHLQMEAGWHRARAILAEVAEGRLQRLDAQQDAALDAFAALYASHIAAEESIAYPAARALLGPQAEAAMGQEMKQRRGAM
jgi:hemerythrin-like domain-containing protein